MKIDTTHYYKGRDGHKAESHSETDANGNIWQISTHKTRKGVQCTATQGQDNGNGSISFNLSNCIGGYNDKYLNLAEEAGQCNEARVKRVHEAGLIAFLKHFENAPEAPKKEVYILGVGQIIFDGHHDSQTEVIYQVTKPGQFKTVTLDGKKLSATDTLNIGDNYTEGNLMPLDEVQELVKAATAEQQRTRENIERAEQEARAERARKIEIGKKIIAEIPEGVQAVIVAKLKVDDSDIQTDYFASHTEKTVYLAWSEHTRDIFSELRKAAAKFEETKEYSTPPPTEEGRQPEDEHREKYSMGAGYYLGRSKYSGWIVEKDRLGQYGPTLELLQIAAADGLFLCNDAPAATEQTTAPQYEPQEVPAGTVQIIEYSAKAIAVIGETKPIKDILGRNGLGGIFRMNLSCGPGWIFPKTRFEEVQKRLSEIKGKQAPEPEQEPKFYPTPETVIKAMLEAAPEPETIPDEPTQEEAEQIAQEKTKFCTPKPVTGNGFFRESGSNMPAPKIVTPQVPAAWSKHGAAQETNALKLYSERQEGTNTGRAQQGFLF